jgi:protein-disulfide isomerase
MRKFFLILTVAALSVMSVAQQPAAAKKTAKPAANAATKDKKAEAEAKPAEANSAMPSEATVVAFLKRMFGYQQNITFRVASIKPAEAPALAEATVVVNTPQGQQVTKFYITPDQHHAVIGDLIPFGADPFAEDRAELMKGAFGPTKGPNDAPVTIVEFGDLQCPACKQAQPNVEKLMEVVTNAKLIFQSYPLEQLHPWALQAAEKLDCLQRADNDKAWTFITAVYSHQADINETNAAEKLDGYIKMAGGDPAAISACAAKPETAERIKKSQELGRAVGVTGTPTIYINGRRMNNISNIPVDALKEVVDFEAEQATKK